MVAKDATESGRNVYKPRPQVTNNDRVRSEVGETESGNAGMIPNSNINTISNNKLSTGLQNPAEIERQGRTRYRKLSEAEARTKLLTKLSKGGVGTARIENNQV